MKEITVQELDTMLRKLNTEITKILRTTGFEEYEDWSYIKDSENISSPDELQLLDEYKPVMESLCSIHSAIEYLKRPVIHESKLFFNAQGYYESEYHTYHCGDGIEFYFYDEWDEKYKWCASRVEHNGERYYIVNYPKVRLDGLRVRYRG